LTNGLRTLFLAAFLLGGCATVAVPEQAPPTAGAVIPLAEPLNNPVEPSRGPIETATAAALQRFQQRDPNLHAVIRVNSRALAEAQGMDRASGAAGPMFGKAVLIKDNVEVAGFPTTAGSLALANNDTGRDAPIVARLRRAGALILGKTNLSEWANFRSTSSMSGWSAVGGLTRNPYALDRNSCGSSSGSGAAVAAGYADYAIGTETDGSITCPAAMNGIVGLKPTVGLVSRTYIIPISESQDTAGPMTRTVAQAAELLSAIAGSDPQDRATREADARRADYVAGLSPDALRGKRIAVLRFTVGSGGNPAFEQGLAALRTAGATLVEVKEFKPAGNFGDDEYQVLLSEFKAGLNAYLAGSPAQLPARTLAELIAFNKANAATEMPLFGQEIFEEAEKTKGLVDPVYRKARANSLRIASTDLDRLLKGVDAIVFPTAPAAPKSDAVHGDVWPGGGGNVGSMAAVAGYPHLTVPAGMVRGLPVGLSFVGPKWSEGRLLSFGHAFELVRGPLPEPRFLRSIEEAPEVAPALEPTRNRFSAG
jgi:amidase